MVYSQGDVVLVPFPFRDVQAERARPAIVASVDLYNRHGDVVVAAVTSHAPRHDMDVALADWKEAGLKFPSTARMLLATIAESRVQFRVGRLSDSDSDWKVVRSHLQDVFGWQ